MSVSLYFLVQRGKKIETRFERELNRTEIAFQGD